MKPFAGVKFLVSVKSHLKAAVTPATRTPDGYLVLKASHLINSTLRDRIAS